MNARCGLLQDVIFEDDVDHILGEEAFYESDNFSLNRESKDQTHNNFGFIFNRNVVKCTEFIF